MHGLFHENSDLINQYYRKKPKAKNSSKRAKTYKTTWFQLIDTVQISKLKTYTQLQNHREAL